MLKALAFIFVLARLAHAGPLVLDDFKYADDAALRAAWQAPSPVSPAPIMAMGGDQVPVGHFLAPFAALKEWRVYWDRELKVDLSQATQVVIRVRTGDGGAVSQAMLYFHAGDGWYTLPAFAVGEQWREQVITLSQAAKEQEPVGWHAIDRVRLAFMPAANRDTWVEVSKLEARSGWSKHHAWQVGPYKGEVDARQALMQAAARSPLRKEVEVRLARASKLLGQGGASAAGQKAILEAREQVAQAYALIQSPRKEIRGVWVHHGDGPRGKDEQRAARWKEAIPAMAAQGINAIFPNMLWSGVAYYPSKVLPVHAGVATEGDYLQEIIDAAKPLGMQVHVWKVMWQFAEDWLAPKGVSEPFRKAGRLQVDKDGKETPWLCPCDERNRDYELKALLEVANYPVEGIHLDYIRYHGPEVSFSQMCRDRFEEESGKKVKAWPADVIPGGVRGDEYADFKRENITSFVREASRALKAKKPGLKVSAAVFSYPRLAQDSVFQDWPRWMNEDLLDFICPMTYTEDPLAFRSATEAQVKLAGAGRVLPGIMVTQGDGRSLAVDALVEEVNAARDLGTPGVVFFEWRDYFADELFPYARAGLFSEGSQELRFRGKR